MLMMIILIIINKINNQEEKPVAVSTFDISDFEVSESASGKVKMAFKLTNTADTPIETEVFRY